MYFVMMMTMTLDYTTGSVIPFMFIFLLYARVSDI